MVSCLAISTDPLTRLLVTITGSISGVSPTAVAIAKINALSQSPLVKPLIKNTRGAITAVIINKIFETFLIPISKVVSLFLFLLRVRAKLPKTVSSPVANTTPIAEPETIFVPSYKIFG